jgi:NitT/TauT family transport system ATP-binding protein
MRFRRAQADKARIDELLEIVHLEEFAKRRPHELSGGMQQRAALARALAQDADILLMDEPFGALDAMTRTVLHDEFERIWQATGLTVVFVTHDVREAVRLGDRVILLSSRPGRIVDEVPVAMKRPRRLDSAGVNDIARQITDRLLQQVRQHGD